MADFRLDPALVWLVSVAGAVLFASAATHKLRAPARFAQTLEEYALLPAWGVRPFGILLGGVEGVLAVALLLPRTRAVGALAAAALLLIYAVAMSINLVRGRRDIDCGCGGFGQRREIAPWMVARNLVVSGLLALLWLPAADRALVPLDGVTVSGGCIALVLLYVACETLLSSWRPRVRGAGVS